MFKTRIILAYTAFSLLVAISPSFATPQCLSFEDALQLSASRNPAVEAARAERREAAADLKEARSLSRPQLSGFGRAGLGDIGAANSVVQNQFGVRASQRIYDFGDARLARDAAKSREMASSESVRQEQQVAAREAGEAYLDHLEADAQLKATDARREYFRDLLKSVDALLNRGGATRSERADVAARLADAEAAALELRFLRDRARTRLQIDTGLDLPLCAASMTSAVLEESAASLQTRDEAVHAALSNSPILKALEKRAASFDATRRREKRARLPIVEVVGIAAYASSGSSNSYEFQERIGVDVSVPLYSGSSLGARYDRADARGALASAEAARASRQLQEDVSITFQRILSLEGQLISRHAVEQHKEVEVKAAMVEFERGVRTLRDLIETRLDFENATLQRIHSEYELKRQKLELLTLTAALPLAL